MYAEIFSENQLSLITKEVRDQHFDDDRETVSHLNFLIDYVVPQFTLNTFMLEYNLSEIDALKQIENQTNKINLLNLDSFGENEVEGSNGENDDNFF